MNKKSYIIIAIVAVVALVFWWWLFRQMNLAETPLEANDIEQELEGLDVNSLDSDFEQMDQELNSL